MKQGKVSLREIGSRKVDVDFEQSDDWVQAALMKAAPHEELSGKNAESWAKDAICRGHVHIERLEPEYTVYGDFEARVPILCPRCGAEGTAPRQSEFRIFVHSVGPREVVEKGDDPDYLFLETPWLDLTEILAEQVVAAEPGVEYPDQDATGNAHQCEPLAIVTESLPAATSTGQNGAKARNSPFAVLGLIRDDSKPPKRGK